MKKLLLALFLLAVGPAASQQIGPPGGGGGAPSGAAGGDLTGTYPNPTIAAGKVTAADLNADVFSTAHSWSGQQTFTAPVLGTPASGTLTNTTGFPVANLAGAGTGVLTALGVNVGSAGAPVLFNGALGTPSSGTLTSATGLPCSTGIASVVAAVCTWMLTPSSANLAAALTDETGTGPLVFGTAPRLTGASIDGVVTSADFANTATNTAFNVQGVSLRFLPNGALVGAPTLAPYIKSLVENGSNAAGFYFGTYTGSAQQVSMTLTGPGKLFLASLSTDAGATDSTLCSRTSNGEFLTGTGTLGICLGTSGRQFKTAFAPMAVGLAEVMQFPLQSYRYLPGYGDNGAKRQYGLVAQDVEEVLPELVGKDENGETVNYDAGALLFIALKAIQEQQKQIDDLRSRVAK